MSTSPAPEQPLLRPEDLWPRTVETTRHALATGALQPIATECRTLVEQGVSFQMCVLGRAHLKDERAKREKPRAAPFNPFEHPELPIAHGPGPAAARGRGRRGQAGQEQQPRP